MTTTYDCPTFTIDRIRFEEAIRVLADVDSFSMLELTWEKIDGDESIGCIDIELSEIRECVSPGVNRIVYKDGAGWDEARDKVYQAWLAKLDLELGGLASKIKPYTHNYRLMFVSMTDPDSIPGVGVADYFQRERA